MLKRNNKKGFVIGTLVMFYAILSLVLIFIIFFLIIKFEGAKVQTNIKSATAGTGVDKLFINYLRSPFTLEDGTIITTAELYSRFYSGHGMTNEEKRDYKRQINQELYPKIYSVTAQGLDQTERGRIEHELGSRMGFYLPPYNYAHNFINAQPIIADDLIKYYKRHRE